MRRESALAIVTALALLQSTSPSPAGEVIRDPTRPYRAPAHINVSPPRFKVNAIIVSAERRIAIVNGKRVGVGEKVNGATVISITTGELKLDVDGQETTLTLNRGSRR